MAGFQHRSCIVQTTAAVKPNTILLKVFSGTPGVPLGKPILKRMGSF